MSLCADGLFFESQTTIFLTALATAGNMDLCVKVQAFLPSNRHLG